MFDGFLPEIVTMFNIDLTQNNYNILFLLLDYFKNDMYGIPIVSYDTNMQDITMENYEVVDVFGSKLNNVKERVNLSKILTNMNKRIINIPKTF